MAHPHQQIRPLPDQRVRDVVHLPGREWEVPAVSSRDAAGQRMGRLGAGALRHARGMRSGSRFSVMRRKK